MWYFNIDFFYQFSVLVPHIPWKIFGIDYPEVWVYLYRYEWSSRISNSFILLYKFIAVQAKRKAISQRFNWILAVNWLPSHFKICQKRKKIVQDVDRFGSCWGFVFFSSAAIWSALIYNVCFSYDWARFCVISMQWYICLSSQTDRVISHKVAHIWTELKLNTHHWARPLVCSTLVILSFLRLIDHLLKSV